MTLEDPGLKRALADMGSGYEDLLLALGDELRRDERVGALFVVGSTAVGEADRYSDLDLLIVARSGEVKGLAEQLIELLEPVGPTVMAR